MSQQTTDTPDTEEPYKESDTHVPNPTMQYGTLDTSGTAGAAHSKLEGITPIFEVAKAQNAIIAAAALDPDQPDVPEYLVTMPPGQNLVPVDTEAIKQGVIEKGKAAEENPVVPGGPSPFQQQAAEEGPAAAATAQAQQADQGAGGTPTATGGTAPGVSTGTATPQQQKPAAGTQS